MKISSFCRAFAFVCCMSTSVLAVPAPAFKPPVQLPGGGSNVVKIVSGRKAPKIVNGVDSGADIRQTLVLSGYSNAVDFVTADKVAKRLRVRVQQNGAAGTTYANVDVATAGSPTDLAVDNVSNHLSDDLITAEDGVIRVYSNTTSPTTPGLPTFAAPITLTANGTDGQPLTISKITTADVNQDGKPDIIGVGTILVEGIPKVQMAVFISTSTGTPSFASPVVYTTNFNGSRTSGDYVVAANLTTHAQANGQPALDSFPEIIVGGNAGSTGNSPNGSGYGEYTIFFNKGDGTFNTDEANAEYPYVHSIGHYLHGFDVGDINGDGFRDLVTEESNDNNGQTFLDVYYGETDGYLGQGTSTYNYVGTNTSRTFLGGIVIGDLNNDGKPDIGMAFEKKVYIYALTSGDPQSGGNFPGEGGSIFLFDITAGSRTLELTDSNHDGHLDVLVAEIAPQELALVVNGLGGGTAPAGAPTAPTLSSPTIRFDQQVTVTTTYTPTSAKDKVSFLYKISTGNDYVKFGAAEPAGNSTWKFTGSLPALGSFTFKAQAVPPRPAVTVVSDESDPLTVTLPKLTVLSVTPVRGKTSGTVVISGPVAPGVTLKLQASSDGSNFSDVAIGTVVDRGGKYTLTIPNLPADLPYYRVISTLGSQSLESDNFSLFGVDAMVALVTNDTTTADDATLVVKTAAYTGAGVVADDARVIPSRAALVPWGDYRTFAIQAKNTSKFTETVSFNGHTGNANFSINYLAAAGTTTAPLIGGDITSVVTTSGYPRTLAPGASAVIYARVHCYPGVTRGMTIKDQITCVVGGDTSHRDSVLAVGSASPATKVTFVTTGQLSGEGGLDNAVAYANLHPGTTIAFEVPSDDPNWTFPYGGDVPVLVYHFDHALAAITAAGTIIDGTSQRDLGDQNYFPTSPAIQFTGRALPNSGGTQDLNSNGLSVMASNCVVKGFNINGFNSGIYIGTTTGSRAETRSVVVQQCSFQGNTSAGVTVNHASNNVIGGDIYVDGNRFRALQINGVDYGAAGLVLNDARANQVKGNFIGLDSAAKDASAPNGFKSAGIILSQGAEGNLIGGTNALSRNLICGCIAPSGGSPRYGIDVRSSNNIIQGNIIGFNGDTIVGLPIPNDIGIVVEGGYDVQGNPKATTGTLIGGTTVAEGNTISGNHVGMLLNDTSSATKVFGNFIGTYPGGGFNSLPNETGIYMFCYNSQIGGSLPGQRNVISANTGTGIFADAKDGTSPQQFNSIIGNLIGGTTDQFHPLNPNKKYGIEVYGSVVEIGDDGKNEGNYFGTNTQGNIVVHGPSANAVPVRGNNFVGSSVLDLDLLGTAAQNSAGRTANDAAEADGLQNFPVIATVTKARAKDTYAVAGTLHSKPNTTYIIDFYVGPLDGDPEDGGANAKSYAGAVSLKSDATGLVKFNAGVVAPPGPTTFSSPNTVWATATALTTLQGKPFASGTSEFSDPVALP